MYNSYKNNKIRGFTLTELLIGLSIGIVVLTGLMSFYFRSSKMIGEQQAIVKSLSQLQFVMNRIVEDIKSANTEAPGTGTSVTPADWNNLPYLGFGITYSDNLEPYQPPSSSPKEIPTYPRAYNFPSQKFLTGSSTWFPETSSSIDPLESNQLAFYKVINNQIVRVLYYTEPESPYSFKLKRKVQYPPASTGFRFDINSPLTTDGVILSDIKSIQFTYPVLSKKLDASSSEYDITLKSNLDSVNTIEMDASKVPFRQSNIMNFYRDTIKIHIVTAGPQIGNKRINAFELSTEVKIRN